MPLLQEVCWLCVTQNNQDNDERENFGQFIYFVWTKCEVKNHCRVFLLCLLNDACGGCLLLKWFWLLR